MSTCQLEIAVLGRFRVAVDGVELSIGPRKSRRLLAELAIRCGRPVSRSDLLVRLWPESDEAHGRDSLRHALWRLRAQLGPAADLVQTIDDSLLLSHHASVDVCLLEHLARSVDSCDLAAALDLYRGDLWHELDDEVAEVERERLRGVVVAAGCRLAEHQFRQGEPARAVETLQRALRHDPYREEVHRLLLEALAATGDPPPSPRTTDDWSISSAGSWASSRASRRAGVTHRLSGRGATGRRALR